MAAVKRLVSKYRGLLDLKATPEIVVSDNLKSRWLGRMVHWPNNPEKGYQLQLQRRVMVDENTLERVIAHEMAHMVVAVENHALNADFIARGITIKDSAEGHGDRWQEIARKISSLVGKPGFVTVTSDSDYVLATETKPYFLLIAYRDKRVGDSFGAAVGVRFTTRMRNVVSAMQADPKYLARVIKTTDPMWTPYIQIGDGISVPTTPAHQLMLKSLYDQADTV